MVKIVPFTGSEKESLHAALDRHRDAVVWKVQGLDDEQLRRPLTPSGTNLLGLVKHLGGAELGWFRQTFGRETGPLPFDIDADDSSDLRIEPHESTADVLAFYARARAAADEVIEELDLESTGTSWTGRTVSLRWVLIHMTTETARHAGHLDILRELTDGATGDHDRS
ncbi:DinB family protein [Kitasatospora sp. NPDC096128]|uniref:DinB family protein n=1 Tax=Kitasatospora sp. NPDC096128 TaxID=3155547 RepID=UPI00332FFCD9